jgi:hypothetical protein
MSRVLVAMSGGVDSSVAASLLVDAGHEVVGVTMKLWGGPSDTGCCSVSDVDDARRVAPIGSDVDHHVFNFGDEFDRDVVAPYVEDAPARAHPEPLHRVQPPPQVRSAAAIVPRSSASTPSPRVTTRRVRVGDAAAASRVAPTRRRTSPTCSTRWPGTSSTTCGSRSVR